jgi:hypothetical protein
VDINKLKKNHTPLQHVKATQEQKPCHHCADTDDRKKTKLEPEKTETEHDKTNTVTRFEQY